MAALPIDRSLVLAPDQYRSTTHPKNLIVLHFTAGTTARGAVDGWRSQPQRVGTAYIIETNGTIFEIFDPSFWAHHLGVKGTSLHDRRSIGIELVNVGPLKPSPIVAGQLNWWPNQWRSSAWCRIEETGRYVRADYRGISYFAAFAKAQVEAAAALVASVCERFRIPRVLPAAQRRMSFDSAYFAGFRGVAAHHNFRADKWDTGPAFHWEDLGS